MLQDATDFLVKRDRVYSSRPDILSLPEFKPTAIFYIADIMAKRLADEKLNNESTVSESEGVGNPHDCLAVNAPRLFLVLSTNLGSWYDLDPSTHSFRLYFLCDYDYERGVAHNTRPQRIHIFDHPGYDLDQPPEFLQQFGHYALTILEAVMNGSNDDK